MRLNLLPIRYTAVLLLVAAMVLLLLEAKFGAHGALAIAGIVCLTFGMLTLVAAPVPEMGVSPLVAISVSAAFGAITVFLVRLVVRARQEEGADWRRRHGGLPGHCDGGAGAAGPCAGGGRDLAGRGQRAGARGNRVARGRATTSCCCGWNRLRNAHKPHPHSAAGVQSVLSEERKVQCLSVICSIPMLIVIAIVVLYLLNSIKILREYERGVIFRLGRVLGTPKGPGIILVFRPIDQIVRLSLRQEVLEVPPQDIITRDNVTLKVNAVVTLYVVNPNDAAIKVSNYVYQTSQFAQTTLRSVLGEVELDEVLSHRDKLNLRIQSIIDQRTEPFGVKVDLGGSEAGGPARDRCCAPLPNRPRRSAKSARRSSTPRANSPPRKGWWTPPR